MSKMNFKVHKCCAVSQCTNTSIRTPEKLFIYVPHTENIRKKWLQLAQRNPKLLSPKSTLYFCEDHFDLPNDMENYTEYRLMGSVSRIRMKADCLPTKFGSQPDGKRGTDTLPNDMQNYTEFKVMGSVRKVLMKPGSLPSKLVHQRDRRKLASTETDNTGAECASKQKEPIKAPKTGKTSAERGREYRQRQRALKPVKVPKTSAERTREWRTRIANRILVPQPLPSPRKQGHSASKTVLQCQTNGIKPTNVEQSETVDRCGIVKIACERTSSVTCEKRNDGKIVKQMTANCLKTVDDRFRENVSDNKVILEIVDPNNDLSNINDLDHYSAVIEQIIDKNDVKTHVLFYKRDTGEQMNSETNSGKLQDSEYVLPDVDQENVKNDWTVDSEIDNCGFKIKMEDSIKLEAADEVFLQHIKQEQADGCPFERGHEEMKLEESSHNLHSIFETHFAANAIKVEPEEGG